MLRSGDGTRGSYGMDRLRTHVVRSRPRAIPALVRAAWSSDLIIAHSMSSFAALAFALSPKRTVRLWSGWGYDYYGTDGSADTGLLGPLTADLASRLRAAEPAAGTVHSAIAQTKAMVSRYLTRHAAMRSDLFSAPVPSDLAVFRHRFPEFRGDYSQLNYASVDHTFAAGAAAGMGNDIQVGNSATYSNNHLDAFEELARLDLAGRRVIVPLSYGDYRYREAVIEQGARTLGDKFTPLKDFMPLSDYLATIGACSVVIMNHRRQQALGNICAAVYRGAHVFLHPENPVLNFLRSLDVVVHSTDELRAHGLPDGPTTPATVTANRRALAAFWGAAAVQDNVRSIIRRIGK